MSKNIHPVISLITLFIALISAITACSSPLTVAPPAEAPVATEALPPAEATTTSPPFTPPPPPAPKGPVFQTSNLIISPSEMYSGSRVTIQVTVTNSGDEAGSTNITLMIDGAAADKETVNLAPGASREVSFARYQSNSKVYSVNVDNLSGTFTVKWNPPPPPPSTPTTPAVTTPAAPAVKDVSWNELKAFLQSSNATTPLWTSAAASGIKVGKAACKFRTGTLTLAAFQTTDYGLIYADNRKADGQFVIWSINVSNYFFRGLPLSQLDIRFYNDQAYWAKLTSAYGQQTTDSSGAMIWDSPTDVNVTW